MDKPDKHISNSDLTDYIKVGTIFPVYGLEFDKGILYVCIFFDERHLLSVPLELFEVVDNKIPSLWNFGIGKYGEVTLWPEMFHEENFLENFAEYEKDERERFKSLRATIENQ